MKKLTSQPANVQVRRGGYSSSIRAQVPKFGLLREDSKKSFVFGYDSDLTKVMDRYGNISPLNILETFVVRFSIQNDVVQIDLNEKKSVCLALPLKFSRKEHNGQVQGYYTIFEFHELASHCLKGKINTNSMPQK